MPSPYEREEQLQRSRPTASNTSRQCGRKRKGLVGGPRGHSLKHSPTQHTSLLSFQRRQWNGANQDSGEGGRLVSKLGQGHQSPTTQATEPVRLVPPDLKAAPLHRHALAVHQGFPGCQEAGMHWEHSSSPSQSAVPLPSECGQLTIRLLCCITSCGLEEGVVHWSRFAQRSPTKQAARPLCCNKSLISGQIWGEIATIYGELSCPIEQRRNRPNWLRSVVGTPPSLGLLCPLRRW